MAEEAPNPVAYPEGYEPAKVWEFKDLGGKMGAMNRPTAGARSETQLPKGEHQLQLYSQGTPNGWKVTMLLEELNDAMGVEYDAWKINIFQLDQFGSEFTAANPNSKIPAMLDYEFDPPLRVFESANILKHVAEKHGMFIPTDVRARTEMYNWLFWLQASAPYIGGGFGHFYKYAPVKIDYAVDRFTMETKRQFDVLDKHLAGKQWVCGDEYTIADMAIWPWIVACEKFYDAAEFLQLDSYKHLRAWMARVGERPATKRGCRVNGFGPDAVAERHTKADFEAPPAVPAAAA